MKSTIAFLNAVKARYDAPSDYAAAKILGVTHQTVSKWRVGKDFIGDSTALTVARLLEIDPAYVIACAHAERAKKADERAVWVTIMERLGGAAAALLLAFGLSTSPGPAEASQIHATPLQADRICIMSTDGQKLRRAG